MIWININRKRTPSQNQLLFLLGEVALLDVNDIYVLALMQIRQAQHVIVILTGASGASM